MYYKNGSERERGDFKDVNVSSEKLKSRPGGGGEGVNRRS